MGPEAYAIGHYSAIFRALRNTRICRKLAYSDKTHIQNPVIFTKIYKYLELRHIQNPFKDLRWSFLQKQLKTIIIFLKRSILDLWQGSEIFQYLLMNL